MMAVQPSLFPGDALRANWPFGGLEPFGYDLVMADPPWAFRLWSERGEEKSAEAQYATMDLAAIKALRVADLARSDCLLWLWATFPMLPEALGVMDAWGFRYVTGGAWAKKTRRGKVAFGTGYVLRSSSEPFLIGKIGEPRTARTVRNLVEAEAREHSRKPDAAYAAAQELMPDARRADLFARETRPGWDGWGNELMKFNGEPAGIAGAGAPAGARIAKQEIAP
jgi:N6-adenosine-specific RNA methylase IME4